MSTGNSAIHRHCSRHLGKTKWYPKTASREKLARKWTEHFTHCHLCDSVGATLSRGTTSAM